MLTGKWAIKVDGYSISLSQFTIVVRILRSLSVGTTMLLKCNGAYMNILQSFYKAFDKVPFKS